MRKPLLLKLALKRATLGMVPRQKVVVVQSNVQLQLRQILPPLLQIRLQQQLAAN